MSGTSSEQAVDGVAARRADVRDTLDVALGSRWVRLGGFVTLALAGLLVMGEANRLVSQILGPSGAQATASGLSSFPLGPGSIRDSVAIWKTLACDADLARTSCFDALWATHVVGDLLFIAGYVGVLLVLIPSYPRWWGGRRLGTAELTAWPGYFRLRWMVVVLALTDLAENVVSLLILPRAVAEGTANDVAAFTLVAVTTAKWIAVAALALMVVIAMRRWEPVDQWPRTGAGPRAFRAFLTGIKWHRYQVTLLVVLTVLMTGSGGDVLDQVPDAQRAWLPISEGGVDFVLATLTVVGVATACAGLGRVRSAQFEARKVEKAPTSLWAYAIPIAAAWLLVMFALSSWRGWTGVTVNPTRFGVAAGVLLIPTAISLVMRVRGAEPSLREVHEPDERSVRLVTTTGDAVAIALVAIGFLGLVRSFTAPGLVANDHGAQALIIAGLVGAVAVWPVLGALLASGPEWLVEPGAVGPNEIPWRAPTATIVVSGFALLVMTLLLLYPREGSARLGLVATAVFALGGLLLGLGLMASWLHRNQPLELFRATGLRAAPLLSVVVAIGVVGGMISPRDPQHEVRTLVESQGQERAQSLVGAFWDWADEAPCTVPQEGGGRVRPLLLVAASGGGIRAAQWTVRGFQRIAEMPCGGSAVLLSSGVSGGSIGLSLVATAASIGDVPSRLEDPAAPGTALRGVDDIAGPEALSAGVASLLTGDLLAGVSGVAVRPVEDGGSTEPFDRAASIEQVWESDAPGLATSFSESLASSPAGHLVLNSASAAGLCRVHVGTVDISLPSSASTNAQQSTLVGAPPGCSSTAVANSYALATGRCLPPLRASSAAMLSARFPVVTPSGILSFRPTDACQVEGVDGGESSWDQLIDGGYAESTGLGTIVDIAPILMPQIRAYNATAAGQAAPITPFVVFLENGYGFDAVSVPSDGVTEPEVPIRGSSAKGRTGSDTLALLQRADQVYADYIPGPGHEMLERVAVVAPRTKPRVEAPLGWVLSVSTRMGLAQASAQAFDAPTDSDAYSVCHLIQLLDDGQLPPGCVTP